MSKNLLLRMNLINYSSPKFVSGAQILMKFRAKLRRCTLAVAVAAGCLGDAFGDERLADARAAVSQWVDVERTISREALAWAEKKILLNDLVAVAQAEIKTLKANIAEADKATGVAETRRAQLVEKRDNNAALAKTIETFLVRIEGRLRALTPRLPKPLTDKLASLIQRLPKDSEDTELGIAVRMQTVMGYIAEVQRFDTMVTLGEELRDPGTGEPKEVRTIHFGLGAAYYVAADDSDAGFGGATEDGWNWQSQPALAPAIREAVTTAQGKQREARFLALPVATKEVEK